MGRIEETWGFPRICDPAGFIANTRQETLSKRPWKANKQFKFPDLLTLACAQPPYFSPWVVFWGVPIGFSPMRLQAPNRKERFNQAATLVSSIAVTAQSVRGNIFRKIILVSSITNYYGRGVEKLQPMGHMRSITYFCKWSSMETPPQQSGS